MSYHQPLNHCDLCDKLGSDACGSCVHSKTPNYIGFSQSTMNNDSSLERTLGSNELTRHTSSAFFGAVAAGVSYTLVSLAIPTEGEFFTHLKDVSLEKLAISSLGCILAYYIVYKELQTGSTK